MGKIHRMCRGAMPSWWRAATSTSDDAPAVTAPMAAAEPVRASAAARSLRTFRIPRIQAALIVEGRNAMPAFDYLTDADVDAVVRYTREILGPR